MIVLAAAAHPDDIEFMMAGTLLRLKDSGCEIHLWNLANGCCGSNSLSREQTIETRWREACASAALAGGAAHPPLFNDLEVFYDKSSLAKVAAVVRSIGPDIILTHPPGDYMEDHQNACRLVVAGAFMRGMRNATTDPSKPPFQKPLAIYHAMPHGLKDSLRNTVEPHFYIDTSRVQERKRAMLACHASQKEWLDQTQGMNAYLDEMERMGAEVGAMSGKFEQAEGWCIHSHLGFADALFDPVRAILQDHQTNPNHINPKKCHDH